MKRVILLTGRPGIGKTSVLLKAVEELKVRDLRVGGMISREVRERGSRVGFEILDLATGRRGWLAHVKQPSGPKVGKYRVNLEDLNLIGVVSIENAIRNADVVVVDEIGPMELFSPSFKRAVAEAVRSGRLMLGTVHRRARDPLIDMIKARRDVEILEVTPENRGQLHKLIIGKLLNSYKASKVSPHACRRS